MCQKNTGASLRASYVFLSHSGVDDCGRNLAVSQKRYKITVRGEEDLG